MLKPMFTVKVVEKYQDYGSFIYEPLHTSFGNTIGNAFRRTLLSSLPGYAITNVKFKHASHFFTTISGVKESVLDIVLNLKQVRFESEEDGPFDVKISAKGKRKIFAKDLEGNIKVVNGDLYLGEITDAKGVLEMEGIVRKGYGYQSEEEIEEVTGYVRIDGSFSPVTRVNFKVEEARVGSRTDFERLLLEVWTDGSIDPEESIKQAGTILANHFSAIISIEELTDEDKKALIEASKLDTNPKAYETIIDELNLPSRVINALLRENIETVADLVERGYEDLVNLKGVGKKSIDLIEEELKKMDVSLK